jgi:Spy/CpxP family protein refolding chaperone
MRKFWTKGLAACLLSMATLAWAGVGAAQEPAAPPGPPGEETAPHARPGRGGNIENRLENLSKQLNLTDEQKAKIHPLLQREVERVRDVRNNTSLSKRETHKRISTIRRNTNKRIGDILTPEQRKQWKENQEERRGESRQRGPGGGAGPEAPPK